MKNSAIIIAVAIMFGSCTPGAVETGQTTALVPVPKEVSVKTGVFRINKSTKVLYHPESEELKSTAEFLAGLISKGTGFNILTVAAQSGLPDEGSILLVMEDSDIVEEGYALTVSPQSVVIESQDAAGVFYGVQTLRQLLPVKVEIAHSGKRAKWEVPAVEIRDEPRYGYRGLHLDVGRHFFPVEFVKSYLDVMALHKLNKFHWHLTEDQGWRIEIKAYPRLAEVAAFRDETLIGHYSDQPHKFDGERYGGYYTHEEIKEVVEYAGKLHIDVIPEIEMPGHSLAALAAYPELGCTGGPYEVARYWGVFNEVYCAGKEGTFEFLENVLAEVIELFPYEYIHIGGDECPKERWEECPECQARIGAEGLKDEHELQSYFIKRIEKFLGEHDRKIIGWDEILEGGLAPEATVMSWRGTAGGVEAAKQGHDVIMTPTGYCYFDYYQAPPENEPLAIGGLLTLKKVYSYEPATEDLTGEEAQFIRGVQGNLWTEYIKTGWYAEYMAYPRACALSEIAWSPKDSRNYQDFYRRLQGHLKQLEALNVNFRPLDEVNSPD